MVALKTSPGGFPANANLRRTVALVACCATLMLASQGAQADMTLGRWCDRMVPNSPEFNTVMSIVLKDNGALVLVETMHGEKARTAKLRETNGRVYEEIGSDSGDKFRIIPSTGNLQLLDDDGLIRVARRLENQPKPGECR